MKGGTYERAPGKDPPYPATVSTFCLDKYEVTVGRFRAFVKDYDRWRAEGHPGLYDGSHERIGAVSGWDSTWDGELPATAEVFTDAEHLNSGPNFQTWRDVAGTARDERRPINRVNWYEAFAFCLWDGGRLPTEAEWQYAAQGGAMNRQYPWGNEAPDSTRAVYYCTGDGSASGDCTYADILPVGSRPSGDGPFKHSDLAGSMQEWNLDWSGNYILPCEDCARTLPGYDRVIRGGSWNYSNGYLAGGFRYYSGSAYPRDDVGLRCARPTP